MHAHKIRLIFFAVLAAAAPPARAADPSSLPGLGGGAIQEPAPASAEPDKAVCGPAGAGDAAPLQGCAGSLDELTAGYRNALAEIERWTREQSDRVTSVREKVRGIKEQIQKNTATITDLKFKRTRDDNKRIKDLEKENKKLWKQLGSIDKEMESVCRLVSKGAAEKHKELERMLRDRLKAALSNK